MNKPAELTLVSGAEFILAGFRGASILQSLREGHSRAEICRVLGVKAGTICRVAKQFGLAKVRRHQKSQLAVVTDDMRVRMARAHIKIAKRELAR